MQKPRTIVRGYLMGSGDVLLSHGECHTIIGAKMFHGPVRNGKAWSHFAMVARKNVNAVA